MVSEILGKRDIAKGDVCCVVTVRTRLLQSVALRALRAIRRGVYPSAVAAGEFAAEGARAEKPGARISLARLAEIRRQAEARDQAAAEAAKPKVVASVSPQMAEAIKSNPTSLRLSVNVADEPAVVDRPRRTEVLEVLEVDRQGRPSTLIGFAITG